MIYKITRGKAVFPKGITKIEKNAFLDCDSLTSVTIPKSVTEIGESAFKGCMDLKQIIIPNSVINIREGAFAHSFNLEKVVISNSVTKIEDSAFAFCSSLKKAVIPNSVTEIGEEAFSCCKSLSSVTISDSVTKIGKNAFAWCFFLENVVLSNSIKVIEFATFRNCAKLTSITISNNVERIEYAAFLDCQRLTSVTIPESVKEINGSAFHGCESLALVKISTKSNLRDFDFLKATKVEYKYIYLTKDGSEMIISADKIAELEKNAYVFEYNQENVDKFKNKNYRQNYFTLLNWKEEGKIKFIPPDYTLDTFPASEIDKYFINKNNQRWGKLVKTLGFDRLDGVEKTNTLSDLMKIYYAIGGFSENQGESESAYDYILKYVAKGKAIIGREGYAYVKNPTPRQIGEEIHSRFSKLELKGKYNKIFAQFFMKYYKDNPDFMQFTLEEDYAWGQDYLCMAHNNFETILKHFPNRVVNGNTERDLLSPKFVAEHCNFREYEDVNEGNESLAEIIGRYGYSQEQFYEIQALYEQAKNIKDQYVIMADRADEAKAISFRVLEKDDPLGFVLGDITNCCQHLGGAGESCVDDGYKNPNAGFLVFEESILDDNGNLTGEKRILGQAYVWYDPKTKTVCYDNIEIPTKVINELRRGDKHDKNLSSEALLDAVEESAEAIMNAMNRNGIEVDRVTTGEGYNDLKRELTQRFKREDKPIARHRNYHGYSDASEAQYIIKTRNAYKLAMGKQSSKAGSLKAPLSEAEIEM